MSSLRTFLTALALLPLLSGTAFAVQPFPAECKLTLATTLPITLSRGHVIVPGAINGEAASLILDTGGFASAISDKVVERQKLKTYGIHHVQIEDVGGKNATSYATLDTLTIGNQRSRDIRLMVAENIAEDGVIAPDLLRNFDLEFDFAGGVVNLFRHHPCSGKAVYWTDDYFQVPMDVTEQGHIRVDVTLDGKPMRAMLDTGAPATLVGEETARSRLGVQKEPINVEGGEAIGLTGGSGGTASGVPHRFGRLQLGGIALRDPILLISSAEKGWRSERTDLLLGMRDLHNLHLYVAYEERKLYVSRANASAADPAVEHRAK